MATITVTSCDDCPLVERAFGSLWCGHHESPQHNRSSVRKAQDEKRTLAGCPLHKGPTHLVLKEPG